LLTDVIATQPALKMLEPRSDRWAATGINTVISR
jgi:hypothetical protein